MARKQATPPAPRRAGRGPRQRPAPPKRHAFASRRTLLIVAGAVLVAAVLVAVSLLSARGGEETTSAGTAAATTPAYLEGIPQDGTFLGDPEAPFVLAEYADVQCPFCAEYGRNVLPGLVERYVRTGEIRLEYRGLAFLGPDSDEGLRALLAAGEQDKLWNLLHVLTERQGGENSDWVTPDLLRSAGESVPGLDVEQMLAGPADYEAAKRRAQEQATADGVRGTPSFTIAPREGGTPIPLQVAALELDQFVEAIDAATGG